MAPCMTRSFNSVAIIIYILLAALYRANGGLTLFINRRIGQKLLGLSVKNDIFLIRNGEPNVIFANKDVFKEAIRPLSADVQRVEINWFAEKNLVRYSLAVTSSNPKMLHPRISPIPSRGLVKVEQTETFEISLVCSGLVDGSTNIKFVLNYTNYDIEKLDRSSKRTLEFTVQKLCEKSNGLNSTEATPKAKKSVNRTIIITVSAVLACVVCLLVGLVFFWRFVRRLRKKFFNFEDEDTERFSPLSQVSCQSADTVDSNYQVPTVVYSPNTAKGFRNTVFTKIAKRQERKHECCSSSRTDSDDLSLCFTPPANVDSANSSREQSAGRGSRAFCAQVSFTEDDVFIPDQSDKVALIRNENSPNSKLTLAKDSESKHDMFSTLNDYWALQLGDSLRSRQEFEIRSDVIGEGAFAKVFRGKLVCNTRTGQEECGHGRVGSVDVAVKVCQDDVEFEQMVLFVNEAILMKGFNHDNLLNLLGVILQPASPPLILTPYLSHGDLHKFLRNSRGIGSRRQLIGSRQLVNFATQISRGMEYLSGKKVVHRDLTARNCFVDEDLNVKIGDFGLARNVNQFDLHKMEHPTHLAIKWLALESLLYYIFSEKSDIWSFGIVLWELVTLGSQPYAGLDNYEVTPYLETGKRLSRPLRCPDDLYAMMYSCWLASPEERPTFSVLVHKLEDYEVRLRHSCIAFEFDEDTIEMNDDCEFF